MKPVCDAVISRFGGDCRCARVGREHAGPFWLCGQHASLYREYEEWGGMEAARLRIVDGITMRNQRRPVWSQ